jgi:hypothetical protein
LILIIPLLLQAAASQPLLDIQLRIDAHVDRVRIERQGEASLEVTGGEGSIVRVEAPEANGRRTLRNVDVRIDAQAYVADPRDARPATAENQNPEALETPDPQ